MAGENPERKDPVLLYEKTGRVAQVTFNRPEARNALSPELLCRFADALLDFQADEAMRVLIITGAGAQAFCAGGDLGLTLPLLTGDRKPQTEWDHRLLDDPGVLAATTLRDFPLYKPVIAAVNGICVAAGAELLLATDIRVVSDEARFAWPEVQRGLIPFAGSLARLPRQLSHCQAMELLLTGSAIDAQKALQWGLVNYAVPGPEVLPLARKLAQGLAANAPVALAEIKKTAVQSAGLPLSEAFALEDASYHRVMATEDAREGPRAFIEKRSAVYKGR
jgi:enoyl-CoA hydratase